MSLPIESQYDRSNVVHKCGKPCQIFSRIVGYFQVTQNWNRGQLEQFRARKTYNVNNALGKCPTATTTPPVAQAS